MNGTKKELSGRVNRNNNIGTIHILAAFCVMYGHQFAMVNQGVPAALGCAAHILGVKTIMLISGYLITRSLWTSGETKGKTSLIYATKRLGRIFPEFIFVLLVSAFVIGAVFTTLPVAEYMSHEVTRRYVCENAVLKTGYVLPGVFVENPYPVAVNGSLWTIPVELFMYLGIWVIYMIPGQELRRWVYVTATVIASILMVIRIEYYPFASLVIHNIDWMQALNIIPYFLVGGCFHLIDMRKYLNVQWAVVIAIVFTLIKFPNSLVIELFELATVAYIVMSFAFSQKQDLKLPVLKSEYAYGVYLWGFVIQQCVVNICNIRLDLNFGPGILFLISSVIVYVLAMLTYRFIYKPVWNMLEKILEKIKATE